MARKLLISDLDGTLLDSIKGLSQKYAEKLNSLIDKGIDITIATGRDFENTQLVIQNIHIQNPIILTNGAFMVDYPFGEVLEVLTIPSSCVSEIFTFATQFHLDTIVFGFHDKAKNFPNFIKGKWTSTEEIQRLEVHQYEPYLNEPVISIQFMNPKEQLDEFYALSNQNSIIYSQSHVLYFEDSFHPGMYWLEFNPINARKEVMVEKLMKLKNVSREDVIFFGDNYNDLGMFDLVGTVIVVENAPEDLKKRADIIIPSNKDGGVLQYIEQHLDELI